MPQNLDTLLARSMYHIGRQKASLPAYPNYPTWYDAERQDK